MASETPGNLERSASGSPAGASGRQGRIDGFGWRPTHRSVTRARQATREFRWSLGI